jgi:hypothetical protein
MTNIKNSDKIGLGVNITNHWFAILSYIDLRDEYLTVMSDTLVESKYYQSVSQVMPVLVEGVTINADYYIFHREPFTAAVFLDVLA